jgi:putative YhdH/YhfP family quinone oxidoreductase
MILGTAGVTAALALYRMRDNRQTPDLGPLCVTGASGGVGSLAIDIFSRAGFEVHAISGKTDRADALRALGAREVLGRDALSTPRPMDTARFGGGLDNVGGPMLAALLAQTVPCGNVASAGLAASPELHTTVMPFIIRGVSLLGVASAGTARDIRETVWHRLANEWKPAHLDRICTRTVAMAELPAHPRLATRRRRRLRSHRWRHAVRAGHRGRDQRAGPDRGLAVLHHRIRRDARHGLRHRAHDQHPTVLHHPRAGRQHVLARHAPALRARRHLLSRLRL